MNNDQPPLFQNAQFDDGGPEPSIDKRDMPHLATVSHAERFWDVYVEFQDNTAYPSTCRAALLFSPADGGASGQGPVRTAVILVEDSNDAIVRRAQTFGEHQLAALLRSVL